MKMKTGSIVCTDIDIRTDLAMLSLSYPALLNKQTSVVRPEEVGKASGEFYTRYGDLENRIKEQYSLFAGRVSAATMRANQLRLYLSRCLCFDERPASTGIVRHRLARRSVRPSALIYWYRSANPYYRSQGLDIAGQQLSPSSNLRSRLYSAALLTTTRSTAL